MNTQDSNKIIAEFDGIIEYNTSLGCETLIINAGTPYREIHKLSELEYHTSWDWLMPVVEKIEALNVMVVIYPKYCKIIPQETIIRYSADNKISAVYNAIINFIQWYNTHNKK